MSVTSTPRKSSFSVDFPNSYALPYNPPKIVLFAQFVWKQFTSMLIKQSSVIRQTFFFSVFRYRPQNFPSISVVQFLLLFPWNIFHTSSFPKSINHRCNCCPGYSNLREISRYGNPDRYRKTNFTSLLNFNE